MLLRITDGTTTITLHDDASTPSLGAVGARYFPRDPGTGDSVTETADVVFSGWTADVISTLNAVERLLNAAGEIDTYVEYSRNGLNVHRSPIASGRVVWSEERANRQIYGAGNTSGEVAIIWERANYWEEASESNIGSFTIKNGNTSPYNTITLQTVNGNLPSPVKVKIYNGNGLEIDARNFYLNMDSFAGMTGTEHLFSGYANSWGGAVNHSLLMWGISLSSTFLSKNAGQTVQVIAAYSVLTTGIYLRASLYRFRDGLYVPSQHGNEHYVTGRLNNLGTLTIPKSVTGGCVLAITVYASGSGSGTLSFVQLAPAAGAVALDLGGYGWKSAESVIEDGTKELAYVESGSAQLDLVSRSGGALLAWPGRNNRLHLLFDEGLGAYTPSRDATLIVTHRPRRSTV